MPTADLSESCSARAIAWPGEAEGGDPAPVALTAAQILPAVYAELRELARGSLRRFGPALTLRPTELVHEAWLKVARDDEKQWNDRRHFIATAAMVMRQVVLDWARRRRAAKRGDGAIRVDFDDAIAALAVDPEEALTLDRPLQELAAVDARAAQVVQMKFYLGLSEDEVAQAMGVTTRTVRRNWAFARLWLSRRLSTAVDASTAPIAGREVASDAAQ